MEFILQRRLSARVRVRSRELLCTLALLLELALDRVAVLLLAGGRTRGLALGLRLAVFRWLLLLVHRLADLHRGLTQLFHRGLHPLCVVALERFTQRGDLLLDILLDVGGSLVAEVVDKFSGPLKEMQKNLRELSKERMRAAPRPRES